MKHHSILLATLCVITLAGCTTAYYSVWEKLGYEKRDILVSRVTSARDEQQTAKQQFQTTLQKFQELTHFKGGDLEEKYNTLNTEFESCKERASAVSKKIKSVDKVATDLFEEWQNELTEYHDPNLRNQSAQKLEETKARYSQLLAAMRKSEGKMQPVLNAFSDQVLFIKHNLNAAAIASLKDTSAGIEGDVTKLVQDMETSINESNAFIQQLQTAK